MSRILSAIKFGLNVVIGVAGHELVRLQDSPSMDASIRRLRQRDVEVGAVIDIGASDGRWMRRARRYFPDARYLLVDANPVHERRLRKISDSDPLVECALVAAGATTGTVYFDASHAYIGVASKRKLGSHYREVAASSVDDLVSEHTLPAPYLLKLDTHGFEMAIFEGAELTLERTNAIIVEAYNFRALPHTPLFTEIIAFLEERGFRLVDVCEPHHRPRDGALWQLDLFFQRSGSVVETSDDPYWLYGMRRVEGWKKPAQPILPPAEMG